MDGSSDPKFAVSKVGTTTVIRLAGPLITDQVYINELGTELERELADSGPRVSGSGDGTREVAELGRRLEEAYAIIHAIEEAYLAGNGGHRRK